MPHTVCLKRGDSRPTVAATFVRTHLHSVDESASRDVTGSSPGPSINNDTKPPSRPDPPEHDQEEPPPNPDAFNPDPSLSLTPFRRWMNAECPSVTAQTIKHREDVLKKSDGWAEFHAQCQELLDDDDIDAVLMYTMHTTYLALNSYLRAGTEEQKAVRKPWADQLQVALGKLPQFTGTVYRILDSNHITTSFTRGTEVKWRAFSSCSTTLSQHNISQFGGGEGVASSTLAIHVAGAAEVGPLNPYGESEILLPAGWTGHVVGTIDRYDNRVVHQLNVPKHSTFLELRQEGVSSPPDTGAVDEHSDFRSAVTFAYLHHFLLPSFRRNHQLASENYERAIALEPNNAEVCGRYALLLTEVLKQHEKAAEYYERAIALDPNDASIFNDFAGLLTDHLGQHEKAAEYYERAIALDPNYAFAYSN